MDLKNFDEAIAEYTRAVNLSTRKGESSDFIGGAYGSLREAWTQKGNFSMAIEMGILSHKTYEDAGKKLGEEKCIVELYITLGEYTKSLEYLQNILCANKGKDLQKNTHEFQLVSQ